MKEKYIVLELHSSAEGVSNIVTSYDGLVAAKSEFHRILSYHR